MIIITGRAKEVAQWLDDNCPASTYGLESHRIEIVLDDQDAALFGIRWAGCFVQSVKGHWFDDEPIVRVMLDLQRSIGGQ